MILLAYANLELLSEKQNVEKEYHIISQFDYLTPEEVIKTDIIAQNNHDLSTYLSLRTTKVGPLENRNEIMILREKYPEYDILQNAVKAQVVGIKSIPLSLVTNITKINEYREYKKFMQK